MTKAMNGMLLTITLVFKNWKCYAHIQYI